MATVKPILSAVAVSLLLLVPNLHAQSENANPAELQQLRTEFKRRQAEAMAPVIKWYESQLATLERRLAESGNKEGALTAQIERQSLTSGNTAAPELAILSATYGAPAKKKVIDVSARVRSALASGQPSMQAYAQNGPGRGDPAPGIVKVTTITYTINGQKKEKAFGEGDVIDFKKDLQ